MGAGASAQGNNNNRNNGSNKQGVQADAPTYVVSLPDNNTQRMPSNFCYV